MHHPVALMDPFVARPRLQPKFGRTAILLHELENMESGLWPFVGPVGEPVLLAFSADISKGFETLSLLIVLNHEGASIILSRIF